MGRALGPLLILVRTRVLKGRGQLDDKSIGQNSLAVELFAVWRLEEAKNVSQIVLASPFASPYPEYRETREEIALKGCSGLDPS